MTIYDPIDFIIGGCGIVAGVVGGILIAASGVSGSYDYFRYYSWIPVVIFASGGVVAAIVAIALHVGEQKTEEVY